jgi:hypothetical protein
MNRQVRHIPAEFSSKNSRTFPEADERRSQPFSFIGELILISGLPK